MFHFGQHSSTCLQEGFRATCSHSLLVLLTSSYALGGKNGPVASPPAPTPSVTDLFLLDRSWWTVILLKRIFQDPLFEQVFNLIWQAFWHPQFLVVKELQTMKIFEPLLSPLGGMGTQVWTGGPGADGNRFGAGQHSIVTWTSGAGMS